MVEQRATLSVVIPAFNERTCIGDSVKKLARFAQERHWPTEVIVVDDGSNDNTAAEVARIAVAPPVTVRVLRQAVNQGKGAAVRRGMAAATGRLRAYMDADLSYDLTALDLAAEAIACEGADIVVGDRTHPESRSVRPYPWFRKISGQMFSVLIQVFLFREVFDTQCGFKCCTAALADELFPRLTIPGFGFDVELLYLAARRGKRIRKIPVVLHHSRDSKVRVVHDAVGMFANLFEIRRNYRLGRYDFGN